MTNELAYLQPADILARIYCVPEANVWLEFRQEQPDLTLDQVADLAAPILESLTIIGG